MCMHMKRCVYVWVAIAKIVSILKFLLLASSYKMNHKLNSLLAKNDVSLAITSGLFIKNTKAKTVVSWALRPNAISISLLSAKDKTTSFFWGEK